MRGMQALTGEVLDSAQTAALGAATDDPWARCVADFLAAKERRTDSTQTRLHYERTLQAFAAVVASD